MGRRRLPGEKEAELCFPHMLNSSCRRSGRPPAESMFMYIILCSMSVLTVALNLLVIISISHFKQLHTPTNLLLLSLGVADFFVGLLLLFQIPLLDGCWYLGDLMCVFYYIFMVTTTCASIGTMVLISVDRYVAICYPLQYPVKITPKRAGISVFLCWTCSFLYDILMMKDNFKQPGKFSSCSGDCVVRLSHVSQVVDQVVSFFLPITVIVVLYARVFAVAVSQGRAMRSHVAAVPRKTKVRVRKSEMKAAGTLGVVVFVFFVCLFPSYSASLSGQETVIDTFSAAFMFFLAFFNSCLNPIIYAFFYPWFRKSIKLIMTLGLLKDLQELLHRKNLPCVENKS
uniref:G-protein coupled receptors family 1 profile domain-containing protein n=1 Tax=Oryzias latipes TaxID=8090 RepID=A0A3P9KMV6_ORYLA